MDYTERLVDMMQNSSQTESLLGGPLKLLQQLNTTQLFKAVDIAANSLTNGQLKDFNK